MPIDPSEEFLKHAAECKLMAKFARASEVRVAWQSDGNGALSGFITKLQRR
jgi:hypothetical protein